MEKSFWLIIGSATSLFALSLFLPALLFKSHDPLSGAHVLTWGWLGVLTLDIAWFANPAFVFASYAFLQRNFGRARIFAGGSLLLGALSFFAKEWWFNEGSGTPITGLGAAFYIWLMSFAVLFAGSWAMLRPNAVFDADASR